MKSGLWITPDRFVEFGESPNQAVLAEIATRQSAGDMSGFLAMLPDPDPVLRKTGDGVAVLDELMADDQVTMAVMKRKLRTLKRGFDFYPGQSPEREPAPDAVRLRDELAADLENIDLYNLVSQLLDAPFYGSTVVEILWRSEGGRLRIADLVVKPRRWFAYDDQNRLCFRGENGLASGEPLPFGKFVVARHFPTFENPYGLRLLSRCLWPVAFKKGGWRFWMQFAERFGMPWVIGKLSGGTDEDLRKANAALMGLVQNAVAAVRGVDVTLAETSSRGGGGSVHPQVIDKANAAISKVLMGQTLTAEVGDSGSRSLGDVHDAGLDDISQADETLVATALTEIAWIYARLNAPGALCPVARFAEDEDLQAGRAERDLKLKQANPGLRFKSAYYERRFGLEPDEFEIVTEARIPSAEFAEGDKPFSLEQADIEALVDQALPEGVRAMEGVAARILAAVEAAESPDALQAALATMIGEDAGFEEVLSGALLAADLTGRWQIQKDIKRGS